MKTQGLTIEELADALGAMASALVAESSEGATVPSPSAASVPDCPDVAAPSDDTPVAHPEPTGGESA